MFLQSSQNVGTSFLCSIKKSVIGFGFRNPKRDVIECQSKPLVLMTSQTKTSLHRVSGSNHKENSWVSTHHLKGHVNDHDLPMGFFLLRPKKLGQPPTRKWHLSKLRIKVVQFLHYFMPFFCLTFLSRHERRLEPLPATFPIGSCEMGWPLRLLLWILIFGRLQRFQRRVPRIPFSMQVRKPLREKMHGRTFLWNSYSKAFFDIITYWKQSWFKK